MENMENIENTETTENTQPTPVYEPVVTEGVPVEAEPPKKAFAVAGFVCGLVGFLSVLACCCCGEWFITAILGLLGVIFGIVALVKKQAKRGLAIAGIILGGLAVVSAVALLVLALILANDPTATADLLKPVLDSIGFTDYDGLKALIESGADSDEISQFITDSLNSTAATVEETVA